MSANEKTFDKLASLYQKEEKEILVLTNDESSGASKSGQDTWWTASQDFLAYIDTDTNELKKGDGRMEWGITDEDRKEKGSSHPYYFKNGCIYRLKVRDLIDRTVPEGRLPSFYNRFLVVSVLDEKVQNKDLQAVLDEYRKPVTITDELLGEFELNKDLGLFEGEINWLGENILAYLEVDKNDKETWAKAMQALRNLYEQQQMKDAEFRAFAANKLAESAEEWRDPDYGDVEITRQSFAERISLSELTASSKGGFTAYYDDDDMFGGHIIMIEGNFTKGLKDAYIAG